MDKLQQLHPDARVVAREHLELVQRILAEWAPQVVAKLSHTWRSHEEQNALYAKGRTAPGAIVTRARPKDSAHCVTMPDGTPAAIAWDIILIIAGKLVPDDDPLWHIIPAVAGLVAPGEVAVGADFRSIRDLPHTEIKGWQALCHEGTLK